VSASELRRDDADVAVVAMETADGLRDPAAPFNMFTRVLECQNRISSSGRPRGGKKHRKLTACH
jgi:hypothetical protein